MGNGLRGNQIGVLNDDHDVKIYEVKGYEVSEWIIERLDVFMSSGDTLYKAVGVSEVPSELEQHKDYDF